MGSQGPDPIPVLVPDHGIHDLLHFLGEDLGGLGESFSAGGRPRFFCFLLVVLIAAASAGGWGGGADVAISLALP